MPQGCEYWGDYCRSKCQLACQLGQQLEDYYDPEKEINDDDPNHFSFVECGEVAENFIASAQNKGCVSVGELNQVWNNFCNQKKLS